MTPEPQWLTICIEGFHQFRKGVAIKRLREAAKLLGVDRRTLFERTGEEFPWRRVRIAYHVDYKSRPPDRDNVIAAAKPCVDGLVLAGILEDDNPAIVAGDFAVTSAKSPQPKLYVMVRKEPE